MRDVGARFGSKVHHLRGGGPGMRSDEDGPSSAIDPAAYLSLAAMVIIGSSTATAAKVAVRELPIGLLPILRFGLAGLCLLPWTWRPLLWMIRRDAGRMLGASLLCVPINQ